MDNEILSRVGDRRALMVVDANVASLYPELISLFPSHYLLEACENIKTREEKARIEDFMLGLRVKRDEVLLGVGGGITTDLTAFVASTYMRGIQYIAVPTTLMGMVDAAIGGKCGVNTSYGKNQIGAFYEAESIYIDAAFLKTLPMEEVLSGVMEIIKYGLIWDISILNQFEKSYRKVSFLKKLRAIKEEIVAKDREDRGIRQILNYGHTMAHAIEVVSGYKVTHGRALWFGLLFETKLSEKLGYLTREEYVFVRELLFRHIHYRLEDLFPFDQIYSAMQCDKKNFADEPAFVCLEKLGKVLTFNEYFTRSVNAFLLKDVYNEVRDQAQQAIRDCVCAPI